MIKKRKKDNQTNPPAKKIAKIEEENFQPILAQRHRLMWLGVIFSALIIILLWFFSWQIKFPTLSVKETPSENNLGNLLQEFKQTLTEAKSSLSNINQVIKETEATNQLKAETTEKLKEKVLNQLEEQEKKDISIEEGKEVIIFK